MSNRPFILFQVEPFIYHQSSDISDVIIEHNKNKFPNVLLVDSNNIEIITEIRYLDLNRIQVLLNAPIQFTAYIY